MKPSPAVLPAILCLACAVGLSACKDADMATTAQPAGTSTETESARVTDQQPTRTPAADSATDREMAARMARAERETAALAARQERAAAASRDSDRLRTVRDGDDQAAQLRTARATPDRTADRAQREQQPPVRREPVVTASPTVLDFGEMGTGDQRVAPVTLTNTSDTIVRILDARSTCGCTVANVPRNHDMQPGESVEVDVSLRAGVSPTRLSKRVNFIFEDHPTVVVDVTSDVVAYVTFEPRIIDPETNSDGRVVVASHDGQAFYITDVAPAIVTDIPEGAATEHELFIAWDKWTELRQPRRLEVTIDHPQTQQVQASIRNPHRAVAPVDRARPGDPRDRRQQQQQRAAQLHELAQRGETEAVLNRLSEGEDVDSTDPRGMSLLGVAARHGRVDLMRALVEAGADVNFVSGTDGLTPLMNAAQSKTPETVLMLLEAGADLDARDFTLGNTALSWAALNGDPKTVEVLLNAGATVEVVSRMTGWTPLLAAAGFGETGSVKLLLDAGANPEVACQVQGATAIMYAAQTGRVDNVRMLLERGVNLEARENRNQTVLIFAARHSGADAETIRALLEAGADVNAVDARGMTALDHARTRGDARRDEVIRLLESSVEG